MEPEFSGGRYFWIAGAWGLAREGSRPRFKFVHFALNKFVEVMDPKSQLPGIGLSMNAAAQLNHPLAVFRGHLSGVLVCESELFKFTKSLGVIVGGIYELFSKVPAIIRASLFELLKNLLDFLFSDPHILNGGHGRSQGCAVSRTSFDSDRDETSEIYLRTSRTRQKVSSVRAVCSWINRSSSSCSLSSSSSKDLLGAGTLFLFISDPLEQESSNPGYVSIKRQHAPTRGTSGKTGGIY